jgi:hypothetical protein
LSSFIQEQWPDAASRPESMEEIIERWTAVRTDPIPTDPFDGADYGYIKEGMSYRIWSSGMDGKSGTADDLIYQGPGR